MVANKTSPSEITGQFALFLQQQIDTQRYWRKPAMRGTDPQALHQVRVSLRQMRTIVSLFEPLLKSKWQQQTLKRLRRMSRKLDAARDWDVYLEQHADRNDQPNKALKRQRQKAQRQAKKALNSRKWRSWLKSMHKQLRHGGGHRYFKQSLPLPSVNQFMITLLEQRWAKVQKLMTAQVIADDHKLHRLRIRCKQLRYATDFFTDHLPKRQNEIFVEQLKQLQQCLGDIHDAYIQQHLQQGLLSGVEQVNRQQQLISRSQQLKQQLPEMFAGLESTAGHWRSESEPHFV